MTVLISDTGRNLLVAGNTFAQVFSGGKVEVYAGTMPLDPDTVPSSATKLGEIKASDNSAPTYEMGEGAASLSAAKTWQVKPTTVGVPGYIRIVGGAGKTGAVIFTDQQSIPEITSTAAAIEITLFYFTLIGQG